MKYSPEDHGAYIQNFSSAHDMIKNHDPIANLDSILTILLDPPPYKTTMLLSNVIESFNSQNGTKKEIVMCQSASLALGLSPKDYEEFEITSDEKKGTVSWNKKGQEPRDYELHHMVVSFICDEIVKKMQGNSLNGPVMSLFDRFMTMIVENPEKGLLDPETLKKVEKEHEELEDLYKTFNPAPVEEESKEESKPKGRPRKN